MDTLAMISLALGASWASGISTCRPRAWWMTRASTPKPSGRTSAGSSRSLESCVRLLLRPGGGELHRSCISLVGGLGEGAQADGVVFVWESLP